MFKDEILSSLDSFSKSKNLHKIGIEQESFVINNNKMIVHKDISNVFKSLVDDSFRVIYDQSSDCLDSLALGACNDDFCLHSEPGCQLEIALRPLSNIDEIKENFAKIGNIINLKMPSYNILNYGINPISSLDQIPFLEKTRYKIMWNYMFKNNIFGHMMMKSTCTMQFNIDYSSESDAYRKFFASILVQPILIALFANSRFKNKEDTEFASYRSYIWQGMSKFMQYNLNKKYYARAGVPSFIFSCNKDNFFSGYVEYCMNVPMTFCSKGNKYIVFGDKYSFADFVSGKIQKSIVSRLFAPEVFANNNQIDVNFDDQNVRQDIADLMTPSLEDWYKHVNTIFFETRIQAGYIEMRSLDSCPKEYLFAASDFWLQFISDDSLVDFILDNFAFVGSPIEQYLKCEDLYYRAAKFGVGDSEVCQLAKKLISALDNNSPSKDMLSGLLLRDPKKDIVDISFLVD